jgi:hypothetical protein
LAWLRLPVFKQTCQLSKGASPKTRFPRPSSRWTCPAGLNHPVSREFPPEPRALISSNIVTPPLFILHSSLFTLNSSFFILHSPLPLPASPCLPVLVFHSSFFTLHSSFFILHSSFPSPPPPASLWSRLPPPPPGPRPRRPSPRSRKNPLYRDWSSPEWHQRPEGQLPRPRSP